MSKKRLIYPLELICSGLISLLGNGYKRFGTKEHEFWRIYLPYVLEPVNEKWLPLNREYKPLGLSGYDNWAEYKEYDFLTIPKEKVDLSHIPNRLKNSPHHYYFYNDATVPDTKNMKERYFGLCLKSFPDLKEKFEND